MVVYGPDSVGSYLRWYLETGGLILWCGENDEVNSQFLRFLF